MTKGTCQGGHRVRRTVALVCVLLIGAAAILPMVAGDCADEPLPSQAKAPLDLAPAAEVSSASPARIDHSPRCEVSLLAAPTGSPLPVGLRGRIVDASGTGVADAIVHLDFVAQSAVAAQDAPSMPRPAWRPRTPVATDRDGGFTLAEPLPPRHFELHVVHRDYALGCFPLDLRSGPVARDLGALTLLRGGEVFGRLVDDLGHGIAAATITLEPERSQPLDGAGSLARYLPPQSTDPFGYYRLPHTASGSWRLRAVASRHVDGASLPFDVVDGRRTELPDLRLSPGHDLVGTVVDGNRRPLACADVAVHGIGAQAHIQRVTRTDAAGRFVLVGLPAGRLRLLVAGEGCEPFWQEDVDPGDGQDAFVVIARCAGGDGVTGLASGTR